MKTTNTETTIETTARIAGNTVRVMVDGDAVRIWDRIAGHYTLCHSLTPAQTRRIARRARAK